jgi:hypothetical protein
MDPFPVITGTVGFIDVCWRAFGYLKSVEEAAGKVEDDITALSQEIQALITVHQSIVDVFEANKNVDDPSVPDGVAV